MPYIDKNSQEAFAPLADAINQTTIVSPGELNYLVTLLAIKYMQINGLRYAYMNDVVGALDSAKEEFRRRVMAPYEQQKAFERDQEGLDPYSVI
jgi:hypothetical protein